MERGNFTLALQYASVQKNDTGSRHYIETDSTVINTLTEMP
jgi:hypothetical protein